MRRSAILLSALCLAAPLAAPLAGQTTAQVGRPTDLLSAPGGRSVGSVQGGIPLRAGTRRDGAISLTLEGWIETAKVAGRRDTFPQSIAAGGAVRIRADAAPGARVLGALDAGAGVRVLERRGNWSRVRRTGWVPVASLSAAPAPSSAPSSAPASTAPPATASAAAPAGSEPMRAGPTGTVRTTKDSSLLRSAPVASQEVGAMAQLRSGTTMTEVARDRGWVKVRIEGWLPEAEVVPADSSFSGSLQAADLRVDAAGTRGRMVRWDVRAIGLQTADPLRRGLEPDEPYLLALGPAGENVVLYLAVPAGLLPQVRALPPMADLRITARVRLGRSEPTGAPILDLLTLTRR